MSQKEIENPTEQSLNGISTYNNYLETEFQKKLSRRTFIGGGLIAVLGISEVLNWQDQLYKRKPLEAQAQTGTQVAEYTQVLGTSKLIAPSELAVRNYIDTKLTQASTPILTPTPTTPTNNIFAQSSETPISFISSSSISLIGSGKLKHSITASVKLSGNPDNQIKLAHDGLFVASVPQSTQILITTKDTSTISLIKDTASVISGQVKISASANNSITSTSDGLFALKTEPIPRAKLLLSLPRGAKSMVDGLRDTAEYQSSSGASAFATSLEVLPMNQTLELHVSLFPSDPGILNKPCKLFLFRYNPRNNKSKGNFRGGSGWVHPTNSPFGTTPKKTRLWGGSHVTSNTSFFNRITEIDAVFKDWYGGTVADPKGVSFLFRPAAWFSVDMDLEPCFFPQAYNNATQTGVKPSSYLNDGLIESINGVQLGWKYPIFKRNSISNNRRSRLHPFGLGLMTPNPSYTGSNQEPEFILCSEIEEFVVSFRNIDARDSDGVIKQFAIDWKLDFARGGRK